MDTALASAQALARRWVDEATDEPAHPAAAGPLALPADPAERRALAWALKDLCYTFWSSEPQRTVRAAEALQRLALAPPAGSAGSAGPVGSGGSASSEPSAPPGAAATPEDEATQSEITALAHWTRGIAHLTRAAMREAVEAFDQAAMAFLTLGQPHRAAMTQVPKMMALSMLGQHAQAIECAEAARRAFIAHGDMHAAGKAGLNLGSLHLRRDAYAQAARHYREAAVYFARVGDREHSVMADIGMADAHTSMGDFDEALRNYERAAMRARTHGYPVLQALVAESVALLNLVRGRFHEALAGLESARERYDTLGMPQQLAVAEKQLADAYLELRLLPEALHLYEAAGARLRQLDMPDEMAWVQVQTGRTQALLGRLEPAAEAFAAAGALFAAHGNAVGQASVALARAELALAEGAMARARAWAEQAAQAFAAAGRPDAQLRASVLAAETWLWQGETLAADERFHATLERAHALQVLPVQVRSLTGIGLCARARGDALAARRAFDAAIECFEDMREALPDSDLRGAFLTDHLRPFQELLRMALESAADDLSGQGGAEVLRRLERFRARVLAERVAAPPPGRPAAPGDDAATAALRVRLNWLYRRVRTLQDEGQPSAALADELRSSERTLLERVRRQRLGGGQKLASARTGFEPAALQAMLAAGEALVEYGVLDDELFACVVTHDGVLLRRRLARWPEVQNLLRSVRFQFDALRHGVAPVARQLGPLTQKVQARLQALHGLVWAPLRDAVDDCTRILIAPHGELCALPFAALHDGRAALVERHMLALVPSATLALTGLARTPAAARRVLALGESTRLPHAAHEARQVAAMFPHGTAIVGAEATLAALHAHSGKADVIHLACHAQFRADNPVFSALHLVDGALTAEAAETLPCAGATVVLSACESALAEATSGDMGGLVRGFMTGGAARVLGSLWPVDDARTAELMGHFYSALREGRAPTAALQMAQLRMRWRDAHPFFWAAFVVHGGW